MALSASLTPSSLPLLITAPLLRRWRLILVEGIVALSSLILLHFAGREYLFPYTVRALTYINLYAVLGDYLDRVTLLDLLGERGVPILVALTYYPLFRRIASQVIFNARARGIGLNPLKLARPILVEMVKVAEDLYFAYTTKLYGSFRGKRDLKPRPPDLLFLALASLCLASSLTLHQLWT
jgi:hypothetical protein